ncbi:MAG: DUF2922 domain-containing protein [Synergistaceae bacterium]|nr:DUF2922 domain-containing protein [Synergistaceae bacterium]
MAAGTKLVLGFENSSGNAVSMSFNYAKPSATTAQVKALMSGIITNGSIFENVPVTAKSAKTVTTTENVYDLDE